MIRIGLTGSLGAGKSTVGRLFEGWGARRIDADELAREAVASGSPVLEALREMFGEEVLTEDGSLDRAALRRRVARDPEARRRLEAILHPEVGRLREERLARAREEGVRVVVEEVPLLFEVGMEELYDAVVVVDAPRDLRRTRVEEERGLGPGEFEALDGAQMDPEEKRRRADRVIWNDGSLDALERRARDVWNRLVGRGGAG